MTSLLIGTLLKSEFGSKGGWMSVVPCICSSEAASQLVSSKSLLEERFLVISACPGYEDSLD